MDSRDVVFDTLEVKDRDALETLYNRCFPVQEGDSFLTDFPIWDPAILVEGRVQIGIRRAGEYVASASLRVAKMKPTSQSIGIIGGVVTHPEHRGQGLAKELIEEILKRASAMNLSGYFLWGSEKKLYEKFGFEYGGLQCRAKLGSLTYQPSQGNSKLEVLDGWSDDIFLLMQKRTDGVFHNVRDLNWVSRQESVLFFRLVRDGKCTAFAGVGRGIDLTNMIHEWGGEPNDLGLLLSVIARENSDLEIIFHPSHESQFYFLKGIEDKTEENLCMAKLEGSEIDLSRVWFYGLDSC